MSIRQHTDFNDIWNNLAKPEYNFSLISLLKAPLNTNALQHQCFRTFNFDATLCRSAFRKQFGIKQCAANLNTGFALTQMSFGGFLPKEQIGHIGELQRKHQLHLKSKNKRETIAVINVHWAAEQLVRSIQQKKNAKAVINEFIRDVKILFRLWRSASALKGIKVVVKGRLGRKKKALAQQAFFNAGVVPLSTVQAKIDFDQRVIKTRFGSLGLKLWLCYA